MSDVLIQLPSDQDATRADAGRGGDRLRDEQAIRSGTLNSTKGRFVTDFEQAFAAAHGLGLRLRLRLGDRPRCTRPSPRSTRAGRRDHHHADHRHGRDHADRLPGRASRCSPTSTRVTINVTAATIAQADHATARARSSSPTCSAARATWRRSCALADAARPPGDRGLRAGLRSPRSATGLCGHASAHIGCWSLQQGKHMTTGEGGMVATNDRGAGAPRVPVRQQGVGLRRPEARPLLPRRSTTA